MIPVSAFFMADYKNLEITTVNKNEYIALRRQLIERQFGRMNDRQFEAVGTTRGPLLILAGAGSGKTTVLINRIVNLIKYGDAYNSDVCGDFEQLAEAADGGQWPRSAAVNPVNPWEILAITFTNKAARELAERLDAALGEDGSGVWAATFHSTCARILRRYADRIGYTPAFTIYDTNDQKKVIKDCLKQLNIDEKYLPIKDIMKAISSAKDSLIDPDEYEASVGNDPRRKLIAEVYRLYERTLKQYDAMDFDDLICKTVELFRREPDVLDYWQNRFKYIMIDEYQDSNHAQYMFAKLLAQKYRNICVVGDDDQSIYRFRGATIENILSFEKHYPDAKVIRLEQNYRSTQVILDAANSVIANNVGRKGKRLWTAADGGEKITVYSAANEQDEARYVADVIEENMRRGMRASDHAVLYRMNAQSNALENVFMRMGISYKVVGGLKFFDRKEIKDVLAYLNLINNSRDGVALARIINEPKRGIGDTTVANVASLAEQTGRSMMEIMREATGYAVLSRSAGKLIDFAEMIDQLADCADTMEPHELFEYMLDKTGYMQSLREQGEDAVERIDNVNELSSNILQYEQEAEQPSLAEFLSNIALITDMDMDDNNDDRVVLMTLHTAKGLEFPTVFIVGVEEGIFPSEQTGRGTVDDLEEERRLAYVGITRAKEHLYITHAAVRMLYGRTERKRPSRFIAEIPTKLINKQASEQLSRQSYSPFEGQMGARGGSFGSYGSFGSTREWRDDDYADSYYQQPRRKVAPPKSAPKPSAPTADIAIGMRVNHKVFGDGMVTNLSPMGNDIMVEIAFDNVGTKRVMANYAKLKKID